MTLLASTLWALVPWTDQALGRIVDAAQGVVVEHHEADAADLGEGPGLRLDLLGVERPTHRREQRVAVEQFYLPGQLPHAVDLAASLDLDGDGRAGRVAVED